MPIAAVTPYFGNTVVEGTAASAGVAIATGVGADVWTAAGVNVSGALATPARLCGVSCLLGTTTGVFTVGIGYNLAAADTWIWTTPSMTFVAANEATHEFVVPPGMCPRIPTGATIIARSKSTAGTQTLDVRVTYSAVA